MIDNKEHLKMKVAQAALDYIEVGTVLGVGTGSTVNYFIDALKKVKGKIEGAVASSNESAARLKALSIPLMDLNSVSELPLYVDGADEVNSLKQMIKGGGGALTCEKIVAAVAKKFVCIVDGGKQVDRLGKFPLAIEVIPMARSYVAREMVKLGGDPVYRQGYITDSQNVILDIHNLKLLDPIGMEKQINNLTGVVANGLFAMRPADVVLVAREERIDIL